MKRGARLLAAMVAASALAPVLVQGAEAAPAPAAVQGPGILGRPSGSGPVKAVAESVADLPTATLYHQQGQRGAQPLLLWGNGGCRDNGLRYAQFLREVASQGFFIIAAGHPRYERPERAPGVPAPADDGDGDGRAELAVLKAALDWAQRVNADPASTFHGRIDTTRVGAMGTSCGGLQAIALATDARVKTSIAFNSGVLTAPPPSSMGQNRDLVVPKSALRDLKGPIAYINGGPTDIAHVNALDDLRLIEHVPVFFAENGVGHGGTYLFDANGGDYARVASAWFSWQLKGDAAGARWFQGADCRLCTQPGWSVQRKNFGAK